MNGRAHPLRIVSFALALPIGGTPSVAGQDTLVVLADDAPVWGASPRLVEELRIGSLEGDERDTFGYVSGVATTAGGEIWVADHMIGTLRRYSPEGAHLGDVGRKGRGPGEFEYLLDVRRLPDGAIAAWDPLNTRVHVFGADGSFRGDVRVPVPGMFGYPQNLEVDTAGNLYAVAAEAPRSRGEAWKAYWLRVSPDGEIEDTVHFARRERHGIHHGVSTQTAISPLGYVVSGRNDAYAFFLALPDGRTVRLERSVEPVRYARAERAEAQRFEDLFAERNGVPPRRIPAEKPPWSAFSVDAEGRLWVRRHVEGVAVTETESERESRERFGNPEWTWGEPLVVDVIEPDGRFLGTLRFPGSARAAPRPGVEIRLARGDRVWTVERGEFDEQYVVRYRIVPG